jgi:ClpP class serine protease
MVNTIGNRETEIALQLGKLYTPQQALSVNLIDEIVESKQLLSKGAEHIRQWCKIPSK